MKKEITKQVYESPKIMELNITSEGVLCASQPEIMQFMRESDEWAW